MVSTIRPYIFPKNPLSPLDKKTKIKKFKIKINEYRLFLKRFKNINNGIPIKNHAGGKILPNSLKGQCGENIIRGLRTDTNFSSDLKPDPVVGVIKKRGINQYALRSKIDKII